MVTVVDVQRFLTDFKSGESLAERGVGLSAEDERGIGELIVDQIEFANVLILNKVDLVSEAEVAQAEEFLRHLNPSAEIVRASFGAVPLDKVLHTGRFSFEEAAQSQNWLTEPRGAHASESEEYGISSVVFRADRPFHPERLNALVQSDDWDCVLRSKGIVWLATKLDRAVYWSQSGGSCRLEFLSPVNEMQSGREHETELVVIFQGGEGERLLSNLQKALLTTEEEEQGVDLFDPFYTQSASELYERE